MMMLFARADAPRRYLYASVLADVARRECRGRDREEHLFRDELRWMTRSPGAAASGDFCKLPI